MCSICGGTSWDSISQHIWVYSVDRGRDSHNHIIQKNGYWVGNHRATPTTEVENPIENQPVGKDVKIVFNGIISNADSLGIREGEADSSVLPRVLKCNGTFHEFYVSLISAIEGSFALAVLFPDGKIWLACNYKPIWILSYEKEIYFSSLKTHFPEISNGVNPFRMPPYSLMEIYDNRSTQTYQIPRKQNTKALVICSGGLDSTTVLSYACSLFGPSRVCLLHFNYGCKATSKEIEAVTKISKFLGCELQIIPLSSFGGSSLLDEKDNISSGIAGAEYAHEWVPARNLLMLSMATAYAEAKGYGYIYLGTNLEEAGAYPDNEEQFILDFNDLLYGAVQNGVKIEVVTPLGGLMKHEIIPFGLKYNTPYHLTWSCYRSEDKHCGRCGPCFMRKTAFERNGLKDPVML
jgi:7-cyano-7-deazaguanine synthase